MPKYFLYGPFNGLLNAIDASPTDGVYGLTQEDMASTMVLSSDDIVTLVAKTWPRLELLQVDDHLGIRYRWRTLPEPAREKRSLWSLMWGKK